MTPLIRLLPFASFDGPRNMAADEAMLETAAEVGIASLRFYTWTQPTLTLGYFQPSAAREQLPNIGPLPWVRRSTGGAGIVHHRELTYAFALPARPEWKSTESWIGRFHHLIQGALEDDEVESRLVICGEERKLGEVLCFLHQTPGDLLLGNSKIAGSAQRKLRGALLQHGSLLLRRSDFAPMLPGMEDLAGRDLFTPVELANQLTTRFARDTSAMIEPGDWSSVERERIPEIEAQKYANLEWNAKR
jgi:lipoyl(octanoyl) transferase